MRPFAAAILSAALLSAGCSDDGQSPAELEECSGDLTVSVSGGTDPLFTWTPACRLFFLIVEPADAGTDLWSVMTLGANNIAPPVRYGVVPVGATEFTSPATLTAGSDYKVAVARYTGPDEDDGELLAVQVFTP